MAMNRFEIWLANLNPGKGTEPGKVRPVVVVQTDLINDTHPSTIVCPLTTQIIDLENGLLRFTIHPDTSGLEKKSDVMIDQLRALDNRRFIQKIGRLSDADQEKLNRSLRTILDL
jgi:mRNA interferase MazF